MTTSNWSSDLATVIVRQTRWAIRLIGGGAILAVLALFGNTDARASTTEIIYSFGGDEDGEYLDTDVEIDVAGNLYGYFRPGWRFWRRHRLEIVARHRWLGAYCALQFHGQRGWR